MWAGPNGSRSVRSVMLLESWVSVSSLVRGSLPAPFELGPIMVDRIIIYIDNITGQFGSSLAIDKREKGLETEANCKRIRVTAGCKVDAHAQ